MLQSSAPPASLTNQTEAPSKPRVQLPIVVSATGFTFPSIVSFPPFYTRQLHAPTWSTQSGLWSQLILSYCRYHRIFRLELGPASLSPGAARADLWGNNKLNRAPDRSCLEPSRSRECTGRVDAALQRDLLDFMVAAGTASYDPPPTRSTPPPAAAFVFWRRPEEWGELIYSWVTDRGLTNSIMTFFELSSGGDIEATTEWSDMPFPFLRLCLLTLVKSGRAQVFKGTEAGDEGDGVKFFSPSS